MFGSKKENLEEKKETTSVAAASVILSETSIVGDIVSHSNFRIDGHVKGNLKIKGKLVIGLKGVVEGQVTCIGATIEGSFKGEIIATESLSIKEKGIMEGKAITKLFSVAPGACIRGVIEADPNSDIDRETFDGKE